MGTLIDSEEILKAFAIQLRIASLTAINCSQHLAIHGGELDSRVLFDIAMRLSDFNERVREIAVNYER